MLALSIRQPLAHLIVTGVKTIENRNWPTRIRGPILIHAAKAWSRKEKEGLAWVRERFGVDLPETFPLGGIVGKAYLTGCVTDHPSPWFLGPYGFVLENAKPVPFHPCKGRLGVFLQDLPGL